MSRPTWMFAIRRWEMRDNRRTTNVTRVVLVVVALVCGFCSSVLAPSQKRHVFVLSGTGDGDYLPGRVATISADADNTAQVFHHWKGDPQEIEANVANLFSRNTTFNVPTGDPEVLLVLTAVYASTGNSVFVDQTDARLDDPLAMSD